MKFARIVAWAALLIAGCALLTQAENGPFLLPGGALVVAGVIGLAAAVRR